MAKLKLQLKLYEIFSSLYFPFDLVNAYELTVYGCERGILAGLTLPILCVAEGKRLARSKE